MYNEKFSAKKRGRGYRRGSRLAALILVLVLLLGLAIGGTIAFLIDASSTVDNTFTPAEVEIEIDENVNNNVKTKIEIDNVGTIPVYIRVALVSNWADSEGKICINHDSTLPTFTLGEGWTEGSDGYYYYSDPVAVGGSTSDLLGSDIALEQANDECGLQLEVIASAIQAEGIPGVTDAVSAWQKAKN